MRLLTHNMLQCPRTQGYPLRLEVLEAETVPVDFSLPFVRRMAERLNWAVFRAAAAPLTAVDLPTEMPGADADEATWRAVHTALLEWHVVRGTLRAPDGTAYDIKQGIPNLIVADAKAPNADPHLAIDAQVAADVARNDAPAAPRRDDGGDDGGDDGDEDDDE